MKDSILKKQIVAISILGLVITSILVGNQIDCGCYCPNFPIVNIPACYVVFGFFLLILISAFIGSTRTSKILFYFTTFAGLLTATWFSTNHILGIIQCPVWWGIPLCFLAFLTFALLFIVRYRKIT